MRVPKSLMTKVFLVKQKTRAPSKGWGRKVAERRERNFCSRWEQRWSSSYVLLT